MDSTAMNSEEYVAVATVACLLQCHSMGVWLTTWRILVVVCPVTKS